jgi:hypothetical protein
MNGFSSIAKRREKFGLAQWEGKHCGKFGGILCENRQITESNWKHKLETYNIEYSK